MKIPYNNYSASQAPLEPEDSIAIEHDGLHYSVMRQIYPDQREYIGIRSHIFRGNSEISLRIEVQAARQVAEAILLPFESRIRASPDSARKNRYPNHRRNIDQEHGNSLGARGGSITILSIRLH